MAFCRSPCARLVDCVRQGRRTGQASAGPRRGADHRDRRSAADHRGFGERSGFPGKRGGSEPWSGSGRTRDAGSRLHREEGGQGRTPGRTRRAGFRDPVTRRRSRNCAPGIASRAGRTGRRAPAETRRTGLHFTERGGRRGRAAQCTAGEHPGSQGARRPDAPQPGKDAGGGADRRRGRGADRRGRRLRQGGRSALQAGRHAAPARPPAAPRERQPHHSPRPQGAALRADGARPRASGAHRRDQAHRDGPKPGARRDRQVRQ